VFHSWQALLLRSESINRHFHKVQTKFSYRNQNETDDLGMAERFCLVNDKS